MKLLRSAFVAGLAVAGLAGAAHAGLDFIQHQKRAGFVAQLAQAAQELRSDHTHAAFALQGLDQDRGGGRARRFRQPAPAAAAVPR